MYQGYNEEWFNMNGKFGLVCKNHTCNVGEKTIVRRKINEMEATL